jgi:formate dehydrogenase gamma subunit
MAAVTTRPPDRPARLARFDRVERAVHWANATLFAVLVATGAALYVGPLSTLVGRRELLRTIHVYTGLCLPVPLLVGLLGRWRRPLLGDLRRLNRWDADDRRWLLTRGRDRTVRLGKFNPGQKLNAAFTGGAILVMLATGSIMHWFAPFPDAWRTGATFVHDWLFLTLVVVITGHVWLSVSDRDALSGMVRGWVRLEWARRHRPRWADEVAPVRPAGEPAAPPAEPVAGRPG